jgi:hypothetical protein
MHERSIAHYPQALPARLLPDELDVGPEGQGRRDHQRSLCVFRGQGEDNAFGSFPNHWEHLVEDSPLSDVMPQVLRHSFAGIANDLGFAAKWREGPKGNACD